MHRLLQLRMSTGRLFQTETEECLKARVAVTVQVLAPSMTILQCTKSLLNLPHLPILPPPVTAKQRVVIIPRDQPEEGIDGYGRKEPVKGSHLGLQEQL